MSKKNNKKAPQPVVAETQVVETPAQPSVATEVATETKKLGRPVVEGSKRQIAMIERARKMAEGTLKRGRKPIEGSKRQLHMAHIAEMKEKGLLTGKKGRPIVPGSKNQVATAAKQAKIAMLAPGETLKPGRPKVVKTETIVTAVAEAVEGIN